jgi:hypothetical protein
MVRVSPDEAVRVALTYSMSAGKKRGGNLRFRDAAGQAYVFDYLHRVDDDRGLLSGVYWFSCVYKEADRERIEKACDAIAASFRFDARTAPDFEAALFFNEIVWVLFALICLVVLALWPSGAPNVAFLVWAAIVLAVRNAGTSVAHGHEVASEVTLSAEILAAALALAAVCALVTAVEAARTDSAAVAHARAASLSFLAALTLAVVFFELYVRAAEASGHSHVLRGAIVCLALTWEFWTSGAMVTNRDSTRYPRPARIMFYLGYLLTVATIVFFWVELPRVAGQRQAAFEAELYVAAGIACLGLPFLLYRHVRAYLAAVTPGGGHEGDAPAHQVMPRAMNQ